MVLKRNCLMNIIVTAVLFILLSFCVYGNVSAAECAQDFGNELVVVIDPGHGGDNHGTTENGYLEKEMDLRTGLAMYEELSKYEGVTVYLTRQDDVDLSLKQRAEFAKSVNADFLFAVHYNASLDHDLFGSEVWIQYTPPYNAYGYQFGYMHQLIMQKMGLFSRGIKTKKKEDKDAEYYGILRESFILGVPAAIIEHCHVDETRDNIFCDTEEAQIRFGKADALAVARYFGLVLKPEFQNENSEDYGIWQVPLPQVNDKNAVMQTLKDESFPDVCQITFGNYNEITNTYSVVVNAADYDSTLIYYDYSIDGGENYTKLFSWPGTDTLKGKYDDTFILDLELPKGKISSIILRAYNVFDGSTESNSLQINPADYEKTVEKKEDYSQQVSKEDSFEPVFEEIDVNSDVIEEQNQGSKFWNPKEETEKETPTFISFVLVSFVIVVIVIISILMAQLLFGGKNRRKHK